MKERRSTLLKRFFAGVSREQTDTGCIEWKRARKNEGYGILREGRRNHLTHRLSMEIHLGRPIATGMHVCHTCDNPPCVNPAHLFEGTRSDNMRDMVKKGRSRIPRAIGEASHQSKLIGEDVLDILNRRAAGETATSLARKFGVSRGAITAITTGRTWVEITGLPKYATGQGGAR